MELLTPELRARLLANGEKAHPIEHRRKQSFSNYGAKPISVCVGRNFSLLAVKNLTYLGGEGGD